MYVATLADLPGVLAGTVTFCPEGSPWSELARPGEGEFRMLAVAPEARRRGVAEALVGVCLERSTELGYTAVVLCSLPQQEPAHRIYRRLGFRRTPDLDWSPRPAWTCSPSAATSELAPVESAAQRLRCRPRERTSGPVGANARWSGSSRRGACSPSAADP